MIGLVVSMMLWSLPFNAGHVRLSDAHAFPSLETCLHVGRFQRAYSDTLDREQSADPAWAHARNRLTAAQELWHLAALSRCGTLEHRVSALEELRWRLGDKDYHAGRLPPIAPLERFREARR